MHWLALRSLPYAWLGVVSCHFGTDLRHYTVHGRRCRGPFLSNLVLRVADDFCWMSEHITAVVRLSRTHPEVIILIISC